MVVHNTIFFFFLTNIPSSRNVGYHVGQSYFIHCLSEYVLFFFVSEGQSFSAQYWAKSNAQMFPCHSSSRVHLLGQSWYSPQSHLSTCSSIRPYLIRFAFTGPTPALMRFRDLQIFQLKLSDSVSSLLTNLLRDSCLPGSQEAPNKLLAIRKTGRFIQFPEWCGFHASVCQSVCIVQAQGRSE